MTKTNRAFVLRCFAAAALIVVAVFCRGVARGAGSEFLAEFLNLSSIFIYIGLLTAWGFSVARRVVQKQTRYLLTAAAATGVFLLSGTEFVSLFVLNKTAANIIFCFCCAAALAVPTIALLAALCVGKPDGYKLPKAAYLLFIPAILLTAFVATNDIHGLVFTELPLRGAGEGAYGVGFYAIAGWAALCMLAALIITLVKSGKRKKGKYLWMPLPVAISATYIILYAIGAPFLRGSFGDASMFLCLAFAAFFESCLHYGMIRSNALYKEILAASKDISVRLVDVNFEELCASADADPMSRGEMATASERTVHVRGGRTLYSAVVGGGYAFWTEDAKAPDVEIAEGGADR